ncbi:50S ribosomal protein L5 [Patescibacteria group bacterium]|nr:50S ribosomal protein L5 [Patescibacteria group bacterium]
MFKSIIKKFKDDVAPKRKELFGISNIEATPKIEKVVLNVRIKQGGNVEEGAILETLSKISGQIANTTKARISISNFKIREGQVVGAKVTLRAKRAIDFLDKMINVTLPRVRDFSGLDKKGFDGKGNYTIGFSEHNAFPEVAGDDVSRLHGIEVTIVTTADNDEHGFNLLKTLGFPFKK